MLEADCPDAKFNPAIQDRTVRQAIAYAVDRDRVNEISSRGTSFTGHGILPNYYKDFYEQPADDYPYDPEKAKQMLDAAGWKPGSDGIREKGGQRLASTCMCGPRPRPTSPPRASSRRWRRQIGVDFKVQVVSVDKLTELTTQKVKGKMAPDFDTFIWGWGGDPYDPSILLGLVTTAQIGGSSDSFYSNPEYDKLYQQQAGEFDLGARKEIVKQLVALTQRDLPYLVLTVDPMLQAYRTDRVSGAEPMCPRPDGDIICDEVGYSRVVDARRRPAPPRPPRRPATAARAPG